ncbi:4-amino-4-deoxychorismate lyase [Solimonas aquatica]|uniref:Aminodeoxychorismate lyase n=1 Tax=Solimonas aquatica TaxID=489703 RepID=A0A1H9HT58_9GAMM|nr:aminodeoxychorismate lyase [Solimonas aquatica]SEQ65510.1 4-amino-4-deoxychorismate lyase [Solimonas aquatica]
MSTQTLINGFASDAVSYGNRGLHYGDGVFRTLLAHEGEILYCEDHLAKLGEDCAALGLAMPPAEALLADTQQLLSARSRAVVKWLVTRCAGRRGYAPPGPQSDRIVHVDEAPVYPARLWERGVVARFAQLRLAIQPRLAGLKHLNRLEQVLAAAELQDGVDELLMCDALGHLVGGTRTNLFWVADEVLYTPRIQRCGVAGVMRRRILRLAAELGIAVQEVEASADALWSVEEGFICNALIGLWPLRRVENRDWRSPGAVTQALALALAHPRLN